MAETLPNGAEVPTNSDPYNLTADLRKLALSLNIPIPVMNQSERDGLAALYGAPLKVGTTVYRRDQSMLTEKWNGTSWGNAGHSEWYRTGQSVPTITTWGVGALTQDAAKTTDAAFVTHPANDQIKFRDAGLYAISFTAKAPGGVTGRSFVEFQSGGEAIVRAKMDGEDRAAAAIPNYRAAANEVIVFDVYHSSGADRTYDFRIRITRVG
jgi:hypothetical protein